MAICPRVLAGIGYIQANILCVAQTKLISQLEQAIGNNPTANTPKHIIEQASLHGQNCLYTGVPIPVWTSNVRIVAWSDKFLKWLSMP